MDTFNQKHARANALITGCALIAAMLMGLVQASTHAYQAGLCSAMDRAYAKHIPVSPGVCQMERRRK